MWILARVYLVVMENGGYASPSVQPHHYPWTFRLRHPLQEVDNLESAGFTF